MKQIEIEEDELQVWIRPKKETRESEVAALNEEIGEILKDVADGIIMHIYMIDSQIEKYREGLRLLQPHGSGRIDVRFWRGYVPGRHPTPFAWRGLPLGHKLPLERGTKRSKNLSLSQRHSRKRVYTAERLLAGGLARRAKKTGKFRETAPQVRGVLQEIEQLLGMRKKVFESIRKFRISFGQALSRQNPVMDRMAEETTRLLPEWNALAESRYDELSERKRDHLVLLDEEDKRLAKKGYQFGTMPKKTPP